MLNQITENKYDIRWIYFLLVLIMVGTHFRTDILTESLTLTNKLVERQNEKIVQMDKELTTAYKLLSELAVVVETLHTNAPLQLPALSEALPENLPENNQGN